MSGKFNKWNLIFGIASSLLVLEGVFLRVLTHMIIITFSLTATTYRLMIIPYLIMIIITVNKKGCLY